MSNEEIRQWWRTHPTERVKAQTNKEWLLEYEAGEPYISKRMVRENPIAV
jgi:hypothetical protein